jgi:hypothetical protein
MTTQQLHEIMTTPRLHVKLTDKYAEGATKFTIKYNGICKECFKYEKDCSSECAAFSMVQGVDITTVTLCCMYDSVKYRFTQSGELE